MPKSNRAGRALMRAGAAMLLLHTIAASAGADSVYRYESEEGTLSFTDSLKKVPARYQSSVETHQLRPLRDYARFTPEDSGPGYPERLAARLAELRGARAAEDEQIAAVKSSQGTAIALQTAGSDSPSLEFQPAGDGEPLIVETLFTRPEGKMVTRQTLVARRGDEIVAIVKPRLREFDVNEDIHAEELLER